MSAYELEITQEDVRYYFFACLALLCPSGQMDDDEDESLYT